MSDASDNTTVPKPARRHHCAFCGADMGAWDRFCDINDTCGARECERYARDSILAERDEAHQRLDEDMGWGAW